MPKRLKNRFMLDMVSDRHAGCEHCILTDLGRVVRIAPNELAINDPQYIKKIYGINSRFTKVSPIIRSCRNPTNDTERLLPILPGTILYAASPVRCKSG